MNVGSLTVRHLDSGRCLTRPRGGTSDALTAAPCSKDGATGEGQQWHFDDRHWRDGAVTLEDTDDIL